VAKGVVYVGLEEPGGGTSMLYALDAETGQERWSLETEGWLAPSPTIVADVLYIGGGNRAGSGFLLSVDAATGEELWRIDLDGAIGVSLAIGNGAIYVAVPEGDLYAIGSET
jgi:outer membrane protein assembly factor BamB